MGGSVVWAARELVMNARLSDLDAGPTGSLVSGNSPSCIGGGFEPQSGCVQNATDECLFPHSLSLSAYPQVRIFKKKVKNALPKVTHTQKTIKLRAEPLPASLFLKV